MFLDIDIDIDIDVEPTKNLPGSLPPGNRFERKGSFTHYMFNKVCYICEFFIVSISLIMYFRLPSELPGMLYQPQIYSIVEGFLVATQYLLCVPHHSPLKYKEFRIRLRHHLAKKKP